MNGPGRTSRRLMSAVLVFGAAMLTACGQSTPAAGERATPSATPTVTSGVTPSVTPARPAAAAVTTTGGSVEPPRRWGRLPDRLSAEFGPRVAVSPIPPPPGALETAGSPAVPSTKSSTGAVVSGGGAVATTVGQVTVETGSKTWVCTATVVASANRDLIATAAHCFEGLTPSQVTEVTFIPGYRDGDAPFGVWRGRKLFKTKPFGKDNVTYDVAFLALEQLNGQHIADVVGAQGIGFRQPRYQRVLHAGYPFNKPWNGEQLVSCHGRLIDHDLSSSHLMMGLPCRSDHGSSGGPVLTGQSPSTGLGTVISVASRGGEGTTWVPYLGTTTLKLYQTAARA